MSDRYYTQSLNVAAYLVSKGIEIIGTEKVNGQTTIYFPKTDQVHDLVRKYNTETELKNFIYSYRKVRELVFN